MFIRSQEFVDPENPTYFYRNTSQLENNMLKKTNTKCLSKKQKFSISPKIAALAFLFIFVLSTKIPSIAKRLEYLNSTHSALFNHGQIASTFSLVPTHHAQDLQLSLQFKNIGKKSYKFSIHSLSYALHPKRSHAAFQWKKIPLSPQTIVLDQNQFRVFFYSLKLSIKEQLSLAENPYIFELSVSSLKETHKMRIPVKF
jgi:hypothetical protein